MHETGIVAETAEHLRVISDGRRVGSVTLALGPGMDHAATVQAWEHVTSSGPLASAAVTWMERGHRLACLACTAEYEGDKLDPCPTCGADGLLVAAADDLTIVDWRFRGDG